MEEQFDNEDFTRMEWLDRGYILKREERAFDGHEIWMWYTGLLYDLKDVEFQPDEAARRKKLDERIHRKFFIVMLQLDDERAEDGAWRQPKYYDFIAESKEQFDAATIGETVEVRTSYGERTSGRIVGKRIDFLQYDCHLACRDTPHASWKYNYMTLSGNHLELFLETEEKKRKD